MKGKHARTNQPSKGPQSPPETAEEITGRGRRAIACGIATLAAGFLVLSQSDPMGQNWASRLAPFLILGGYTIIGLGIFLPESGSEKTIERSSGSLQKIP